MSYRVRSIIGEAPRRYHRGDNLEHLAIKVARTLTRSKRLILIDCGYAETDSKGGIYYGRIFAMRRGKMKFVKPFLMSVDIKKNRQPEQLSLFRL